MKKVSDVKKTMLLVAMFSILCLPILLAPPKAWLNIVLLFGGIVLPFLIFGLLLNKRWSLQHPYLVLALSWLVGGITFFLLSSIVLIVSKYAWQDVVFISAKFGLAAMVISLIWYVLSLAVKKFLSSFRQ